MSDNLFGTAWVAELALAAALGIIVRKASPEEKPHFKDYKSAAFNMLQSGLRDTQALTCLLMLDCASLLALILGMMLVQAGNRTRLDWHGQPSLSFLKLGLRELARCCDQRLPLPKFCALSKQSPPSACASRRKQDCLHCCIEFSKVVTFSYSHIESV